jgi:hypothetical protein
MSATEYRVGKNEALFREVNERIRSVSEDWAKGDRTSRIEFVCECSRESCFETVALTVAEYEEVRSDSRRFLIVAGHVWSPEVEREVYRNGGYSIVEKLGEAGEIADDEDDRTD